MYIRIILYKRHELLWLGATIYSYIKSILCICMHFNKGHELVFIGVKVEFGLY